MTIDPNKLAEWTAATETNDMTEVLNAMLAIAECGDPSTLSLLEKAGSNVNPLAKLLPITLPEGEFTFEEFRDYCIAKLQGAAFDVSQTRVGKATNARLEAFDRLVSDYSSEISKNDAHEGRSLLIELVKARQQHFTKSTHEIYGDVRQCKEVRKAYDLDPTRTYGGPFAFCFELVDDPKVREVFSDLLEDWEKRIEVNLGKHSYDMRKVRSFWIREIRPQQMAFCREELLELYMKLPGDGWIILPK